MTKMSDRDYHEARARDELTRADEATDPSIAAVHRELAALHKRRMLEIIHLGEAQLAPLPLVGSQRRLRQDVS
jgi:hypothetical protein